MCRPPNGEATPWQFRNTEELDHAPRGKLQASSYVPSYLRSGNNLAGWNIPICRGLCSASARNDNSIGEDSGQEGGSDIHTKAPQAYPKATGPKHRVSRTITTPDSWPKLFRNTARRASARHHNFLQRSFHSEYEQPSYHSPSCNHERRTVVSDSQEIHRSRHSTNRNDPAGCCRRR